MRRHSPFAFTAALLLVACNSQSGTNTSQAAANASASTADEEPSDGNIGAHGLYPGSQPAGEPDRFVTADPIERVVEWYRDDRARRAEMMFVSTERQDDGYLVLGTAGEGLRPFALKLTPRPGGGTESRLLPYDPREGLDLNLLKEP